jgi:hypothetical protein
MPNHLDEIETQLATFIPTLVGKGGDDFWTRQITAKLHEIGRQHSYDVRYSCEGSREYLCDLTWLQLRQVQDPPRNAIDFTNGRFLTRCVMACEIEWTHSTGFGAVIYDLTKLFIMRTESRVFITQCRDSSRFAELSAIVDSAVNTLDPPLEIDSLLIAAHVHEHPDRVGFIRR